MDLAAEYLSASGATAICAVQRGKQISVIVSRRAAMLPDLVLALWSDRKHAASIARQARNRIRPNAVQSEIAAELHRAAAERGVRLSTDNVVKARAKFAADRAEKVLREMQRTGRLAEINAEYKRRRKLARDASEKFPSYRSIENRMMRIIVSTLATGRALGASDWLIAELFGTKKT